MSSKIDRIIEELKTLSLFEATELVKEIEKTFGVDTSVTTAPSMGTLAPAAQSAEIVEEKTTFDVILTEVPTDKKIAILKIVRNLTGLGLKESKEIVDNVPKTVKEAVTKDESEAIKKEMEAAGAKIIIK
jgi:large subunit ribosomal protein L7/L12